MCNWVEMDVLWRWCNVICRAHKRGFEVGME